MKNRAAAFLATAMVFCACQPSVGPSTHFHQTQGFAEYDFSVI
jgi:hypothetical protein